MRQTSGTTLSALGEWARGRPSGRSIVTMGDKSPKKEVKTVKKDIKEKRRDKQDKKAGKGSISITDAK